VDPVRDIGKMNEPRDRRLKGNGIVRSGLLILLTSLVLALILRWFAVDAIVGPSRSMESTILAGDYVLVNKLIYGTPVVHLPLSQAGFTAFHLQGLSAIHRGDVIVFISPQNEEGSGSMEPARFVKRCVALGGDEVAVEHGVVYVNGRRLALPSAGPGEPTERAGTESDFGPVNVPRRGELIRFSSGNYGEWETFIRREGHTVSCSVSAGVIIDGVPASSYNVEKNYLFVLGDNRNESYDSRSWGFLPEENVIGTAMMVYWSRQLASNEKNSADVHSSIRWDRIGNLIR
jgi:signal peptidase I